MLSTAITFLVLFGSLICLAGGFFFCVKGIFDWRDGGIFFFHVGVLTMIGVAIVLAIVLRGI